MTSKPTTEHLENAANRKLHDSYAVNERNEQITVLGTYGQDPDEKKIVSWRTLVIFGLCTLAQLQNTYLGIAPAANAYSITAAIGGNAGQRIWIVQAVRSLLPVFPPACLTLLFPVSTARCPVHRDRSHHGRDLGRLRTALGVGSSAVAALPVPPNPR